MDAHASENAVCTQENVIVVLHLDVEGYHLGDTAQERFQLAFELVLIIFGRLYKFVSTLYSN